MSQQDFEPQTLKYLLKDNNEELLDESNDGEEGSSEPTKAQFTNEERQMLIELISDQ
jgi:hypothetical protein